MFPFQYKLFSSSKKFTKEKKKKPKQKQTNKQGVCHIVALPFILKKYLKAKEELWKLKYFTMQKHNL